MSTIQQYVIFECIRDNELNYRSVVTNETNFIDSQTM